MKALLFRIDRWDVLMMTRIQARYVGRKFLDNVFYTLSKSGDGRLYVLAGFLIPLRYASVGWLFLKCAVIAFSIELPLYLILKNTIKRERPFATLPSIRLRFHPSDKFSFPSGHTAAAFLMATIISQFFPWITIPIFIWAVFVGFSRVYLGVHYLTDILMGMILGISSAGLGYWITI